MMCIGVKRIISMVVAFAVLVTFSEGVTLPTIVYANESIEEVIADESIEEVIAEESIEEVSAEESIEEVIAEESNEEAIAEESNEEATADESIEETIAEESNEEAIAEESIEEVIAEESNEEAIAEESVEEVIADELIEEAITSDAAQDDATVKEVAQESVGKSDDAGNTEPIYYETNLKIKALKASNNVYTGQKDVEIATPIFSAECSEKTIIYMTDDKGQITTNNYGGVLANAYNPASEKLVINLPKETEPGRHVLTFTAAAPKGCVGSQAKLTINVKIGIEDLSMTIPSYRYYITNKDINIKPTVYYYNTTHRPMYESYIKPTTQKAIFTLKSDNEELLKYITINRSNGMVKISKNLTREVFDSIKSKGDKFRIVGVANDFEGVDEPGDEYIGKGRQTERVITLSTEGLSDAIANANEIRGFICHYRNERDEDKERRNIAIIDSNNKTKTSFSIKDAHKLELRLYTSADADDLDYIKDGVIWKVKGPVKSYRSDDRLWLDAVAPGIITVTAIAADGSGKGLASRVIEIKSDTYKIGLYDYRFNENVLPDLFPNDESYAFQDYEVMILALNDEETEPIIDKEYNDHRLDMEHNYKVKVSGGVITRCKEGLFGFIPTEPDTKITLINNNKGSDGKRVQPDKVYTIHNECFDKIDSDFDNVKIPTTKVVENKYEPGKPAAKIRFEVKNLPDKVVDIGDGHTGYYLTLGNSYKATSKFPNPEFDEMINEVPPRAEIMIENGKYYATLSQNIGELDVWQEPCDFVAGTYKLVATITKGDNYANGDYYHTLNKKLIETTVIITKNNLKANWEGNKVTKVNVNTSKKDEPVYLVHTDRQDTGSFKWGKNKDVESIKITGVTYDLDTANIYKADLIDDDKLLKFATVSDNSCIEYTAEDLNKIKEAVVNAASGKTTKKNSSAQKAAAKMVGGKPDKNGNYDMSKVKPVISGYFTYTIEGTETVGYHVIKNLKQKFEITLTD